MCICLQMCMHIAVVDVHMFTIVVDEYSFASRMGFTIGFASKFCSQPIHISVIFVFVIVCRCFFVFVFFHGFCNIGSVESCLFGADCCKWLHMDAHRCTQMQMEAVVIDLYARGVQGSCFHWFPLVFIDFRRIWGHLGPEGWAACGALWRPVAGLS